MLAQELGRSPTVAELAERIGAGEDEILEGMESAAAYSTLSLDAPDAEDESDGPSARTCSAPRTRPSRASRTGKRSSRCSPGLPERERRILCCGSSRGMTQSQIAAEVGISQMHVSRLLARTLVRLREGLLDEA